MDKYVTKIKPKEPDTRVPDAEKHAAATSSSANNTESGVKQNSSTNTNTARSGACNNISSKPKSFDYWKENYCWINYNENKKGIICSICTEAVNKKLLLPTNTNAISCKKAFVDDGFRTFKNARKRFESHQASAFHTSAVSGTLSCKEPSVAQKISTKKQKDMHENRIALNKIVTSILYLARQGQALRGHEEINSNLYQLLVLRSQDVPELKAWLNREGYKWIHNSSVNEILEIVADIVRNKIVEEIQKARYYGLTLDETSDISKLEQVSICIRFVDDNFLVNECFMGFFDTPDTKSETLCNIVTKFLKDRDLDIHDLRGQCYDGASNVSGRISGLQTRIREIEPRALFVHCSAHNLSLSIQDNLEGHLEIKNVIGTTKDMINFIRDSPKRLVKYKNDKSNDSPLLSAYCPTRWVLRIKALKSAYDKSNYKTSIDFLDDVAASPESDAAVSAKAAGFLKTLQTFEYYFILSIIIIVFDQIEILNTELQKKKLCVNDSHASVRVVLDNIRNMRSDDIFSEIWNDILQAAKDLGLEEPVLKRTKRPPKRYDYNSNDSAHVFSTPKEFYRKIYFEMVDGTITSLQTRFDNETITLLNKFEDFITGKKRGNVSDITNFYNSDLESNINKRDEKLDDELLKKECDILLRSLHNDQSYKLHLKNLKKKNNKTSNEKTSADRRYIPEIERETNFDNLTLRDMVQYLRFKDAARPMFPQMTRLVKYLLTVPGSSCTNERSFSALRRLKNYLSANMRQNRLNNLGILYIYKQMLDEIDIDDVLDTFILKHNIRRLTFALRTQLIINH